MSAEITQPEGSGPAKTKPSNPNRPGKLERAKARTRTWADRQDAEDRNRGTGSKGPLGPGLREVSKIFSPGTYPEVVRTGFKKPSIAYEFIPNLKDLTTSLESYHELLCRGKGWITLARKLQDVMTENADQLVGYLTAAALLACAQRVSQSHQAIGRPNLGLSVIDKLDFPLPKPIAQFIEQFGQCEVQDLGVVWIYPDPVELVQHIIRLVRFFSAGIKEEDQESVTDAKMHWWRPRASPQDAIAVFVVAASLSGTVHGNLPELCLDPTLLKRAFFSGVQPWWWNSFTASLPVARRADLDWLWVANPTLQSWNAQCFDLIGLPNRAEALAFPRNWNADQLPWVKEFRDYFGTISPHFEDVFRILRSQQLKGCQGSPMQVDFVAEDNEGHLSSRNWINHVPGVLSMGLAFPLTSYGRHHISRSGRVFTETAIAPIAQSWMQSEGWK